MAAIGIDLGTINSCVAVCRNRRVAVIANELGNRTTPSYVHFDDRKRLFGNAAKTQLARKPKQTVFDVKRLIGRSFDDPVVHEDMNLWPFTVVDDGGKPRIQVEYKKQTRRFAPEEISAMVLENLKQSAESFLREEVKDAVVAVPVYFNAAQRQATIDAGKIAGLNVLRIINETTATALAYEHAQTLKGDMNVLVFDLGGGHLNVAVVEMGNTSRYTVKASTGGTYLGGEDFDVLLVDHFAEEFMGNHRKDVFTNKKALQRLRSAAETAKITLSSLPVAYIEIDALVDGVDFNTAVTRESFESLFSDLLSNIMKHVENVLNRGNVIKEDIDRVVMVGGSSRIPKIQSSLETMFPGKLSLSINFDEAVASGCALLAAKLTQDKSSQIVEIQDNLVVFKPRDVTGHDVETMIGDARQQRDDDRAEKQRDDARHQLEKYAYNVKSAKTDVGVGSKEAIADLCDDTLSWIGKNETADRKSFEDRLESLQYDVNHVLEEEQAELEELARLEEERRKSKTRFEEQLTSRLSQQTRREEEARQEDRARIIELARIKDLDRVKEQERLNEQARRDEQAKRDEQIRRQEEALRKEQAELEERTRRAEQARREEQARRVERNRREEQVLREDQSRREEQARRDKEIQFVSKENDNPKTTYVSSHNENSKPPVIQDQKYQDGEEQQTILARNQLKNFITFVLSEMKRNDSNFRVKGCLAFVELCESTLEEIRTKDNSNTKELNNKQNDLHEEYVKMQAKIREADEENHRAKLREEKELEEQRTAARKQLEDYIVSAKDEMLKCDYNLRNEDWDAFVNYCWNSLSWICNNSRASKEAYESELHSMIKHHADVAAKLNERKKHQDTKVESTKRKGFFSSCSLL